MLLELMTRSESDCVELRGYVQRFHDADKRADVLDEKLKTQKSVEILYTVGVSFGTLLMGLSVSLLDKPAFAVGAFLLGGLLFGCAVWAKASRR